jgi:hypothetical protein
MKALAVDKCGKARWEATGHGGPRKLSGGARSAKGGSGPIIAVRACSACAGDYEDPDHTAWTADVIDGDEPEDARRDREWISC